MSLKIHVFNPDDHSQADSRPAIVFFFDGSWQTAFIKQFYPHCEYLSRRGMVAFAAEYRVESIHNTSPRECVMDAKSAIRWLRSNAAALGIDPDRIAAGGGSAGGHIAAAAAAIDGFNESTDDVSISCIPNALALFNPVFDNGPEGYGFDRVKDYWRQFSPLHNIHASMPPTVIFLGTKDELIPVSTAQKYRQKMLELGLRCELCLYEDQHHGFFNLNHNEYYNKTLSVLDSFLVSLGYINQMQPERQIDESGLNTVKLLDKPVVKWRGGSIQLRTGETVEFSNPHVKEHDNRQSLITEAASGFQINEWTDHSKSGEGDKWSRRLVFINNSDKQVDVTGAKFTFDVNFCGDIWDNDNFCMADTEYGRRFIVGYNSSEDYNSINAAENDGQHTIEINVHAGWRLKPGQQAVMSEAVFALKRPDADETFRETAAWWYKDVLKMKRPDYPDWLRGSVMYEAAASGHIDSSFSDTGGFDNFAKQVPYLADIGVNFLWLNSVFRHKGPSPDKGWNHYDPLDFTKIDEVLGGPESLRRLMDVLKDNGFHTVGELVPHGGQSVQARRLTDQWSTRSPEGNIIPTWNSLHIDYSSPPWQETMGRAAAMLAGFGMEGVRIDVADPVSMNWSSPRTNHASYSQLGGSLELQRKIVESMKDAGIDKPLLIPESCFDRPEFGRLPAIGYGWSFIFKLHNLLEEHRGNPPVLVKHLERVITDKLDSSPPGYLLIWSAGNHDMLHQYGRPAIRFGRGLFRAIYGICASLPGVPMLYQEDEIGSYDTIRAINWARRTLPEFKSDHYCLDSVTFDEQGRVFDILRSENSIFTADSKSTLVLVNLSGEFIQGTVEFDGFQNSNLPDQVEIFDVLNSQKFTMNSGRFDYSLGAYQTAFLRIGRRSEPLPKQNFTGQKLVKDIYSSEFETQINQDNVRVVNGKIAAELNTGSGISNLEPESFTVSYQGESTLSLKVFNSNRWKVSAVDSLISDRTLRRHYPFDPDTGYKWNRTSSHGYPYLYDKVAPVGRLWQSFTEPLHPEKPSIVFYDKDGKGIRLDVISSNAENIVLTDRTDEFPDEPFALELRFYLNDPDISDKARAFGIRPAFEIEPMPDNNFDKKLNVELAISAADISAENLEAKRMPNPKTHVPAALIGEGFDVPVGPVRFLSEGTVLWPVLSAPAGKYYLQFEAVYSSESVDGRELADCYEVQFNGRKLDAQWVEFNTGSTFIDSMYYFGYLRTEPVIITDTFRVSFSASRGRCVLNKPFKLIKADE
ncbi:alpha/beta hydrolase fold domain-containing protein [Limihaloglobus sulfuriphilus]|uniref:alpha/beta hydrolase fold domain-containing protein n=1 Tax=Limihaloglobus sulfuriphilus TaxID=1851148 RepID=UPI001C9935CE|nr:alpha/beta hydrolase fold domain-containing protein [Limihaloglobus sulfuriphilus]